MAPLLLLRTLLLTTMGCSSPTPCADLDQASCRQSEECHLARGVDPCTQITGYTGCIDREAECLGGASDFRWFEGRCLHYDGDCAPEGLEECFPECLEDTADTGK